MNDHSEKSISTHLFYQREKAFEHAPFDREMAFYESICSGSIDLVRVFSAPLNCEGCGVLSKDSLRNMKYHFVITAAMAARFCVSSGMTPEEAYNLSDIYIMKADEAQDEDTLREIHREMIESYTRQMRKVRYRGVYSKQIVRTIDYISEHLHSRILIGDAAAYLGINPSYLSRLFKKETGITFTDYVCRSKAEEAAGLLRYSEFTDTQISSLLCFSSQSYFIKVFKKHMGMTPKEYKKQYRV